jgi:hypothetical protein
VAERHRRCTCSRNSRSYHRAMKRVLIAGMSGSGKSSVIGELAALGRKAVDTDWDLQWEDVSQRSHDGISESDCVWREDGFKLSSTRRMLRCCSSAPVSRTRVSSIANSITSSDLARPSR